MDINTQEKNAQLAEEYLNHIQKPADRVALIKNHQELKVPVEAYQYAVNGLGFIPIADEKKEKALANLATHFAEKIKNQGSEAFDISDRLHAVSFVDDTIAKRNAESAKFFHDNIDNPMTRSKMVTDPKHTELTNAYYHYIHAENAQISHGHEQGSDAMKLVKEKMTQQIAEKSPEFFQPRSNTQEPELAR